MGVGFVAVGTVVAEGITVGEGVKGSCVEDGTFVGGGVGDAKEGDWIVFADGADSP